MPAQKGVLKDNYLEYPELAVSIIISQMINCTAELNNRIIVLGMQWGSLSTERIGQV